MKTKLSIFACVFLSMHAFAGSQDSQKGSVILLDGKEMSRSEYIEEYISTCTYIPESKKFVIHRCKEEKKERLESKSVIEKGRRRRDSHGGSSTRTRDIKRRRVQWLRCDDCGIYLRGYAEGAQHYDDTGHEHFQRIDLE